MENNNRASWNRDSDHYQTLHGEDLLKKALAWGVWRIPESELRVLGDVRGRDLLEFGCGGAQFSIALLQDDANVVGVDLSERQLDHARNNCRKTGVPVPLVQGNAESLPFRNGSFDIVFCDHGATVFSPPELSIPEASRVLRENGLLAFCISSPIRDICWQAATDRIVSELTLDYFGLYALEDGDETCYQLTYGDWIRLFRKNGFEVEDLIELRPPENATTTYAGFAPLEWARRWPAENIWKVRKQ